MQLNTSRMKNEKNALKFFVNSELIRAIIHGLNLVILWCIIEIYIEYHSIKLIRDHVKFCKQPKVYLNKTKMIERDSIDGFTFQSLPFNQTLMKTAYSC